MASLHTLTERFLIENKTLPSLREDLKEEVEAWVDTSTKINVSGFQKPGARKTADRPEFRNSWPRPWATKLLRTRIGSPARTSKGPGVSFGRPGMSFWRPGVSFRRPGSGSPHRKRAPPPQCPKCPPQSLGNASQRQSLQQVSRRPV